MQSATPLSVCRTILFFKHSYCPHNFSQPKPSSSIQARGAHSFQLMCSNEHVCILLFIGQFIIAGFSWVPVSSSFQHRCRRTSPSTLFSVWQCTSPYFSYILHVLLSTIVGPQTVPYLPTSNPCLAQSVVHALISVLLLLHSFLSCCVLLYTSEQETGLCAWTSSSRVRGKCLDFQFHTRDRGKCLDFQLLTFLHTSTLISAPMQTLLFMSMPVCVYMHEWCVCV